MTKMNCYGVQSHYPLTSSRNAGGSRATNTANEIESQIQVQRDAILPVQPNTQFVKAIHKHTHTPG